MSSQLSGGQVCIKYLVFIFNFLFFIIGCALLGVGIYLKVGKNDYLDVAEELTSVSKYVTAGNLMIAVGVIILIVAFLGCCGAVSENKCMLLGFFTLLLLIFILELAAGIYAVINRKEIEDQMAKDFKEAIKTKYDVNDTNSVIVKTIDQFQKDFKCCGYDEWRDWQNSNYHKQTSYAPASCCKTKINCPSDAHPENYYQKGCFKEVVEFFEKNVYAVGACGIAFAVIQILGLVFSFLLYRALRNRGTLA